jgi:hypothetical protein
MDFGTGNFTIEGWFYTGSKDVSVGASRTIIGNSGNSYTMQLYITTSGYLNFGNTGSTFIQGSTDLADNAWHHFAIARKGTGTNEIAMWVDGVRVAQGTNSQNYISGTIFLGSFDASNGFWNGYLSNLRIVKGTAVYDASNSTITVPTTPLTAITNTSLLTCQSNRFVDNSANAFVITVNGNTSVQAFSPFAPTTAYSAGTVGGSGYFDGNGDYLTVPNNAAFDLGSGNATIEAWIYPASSGQTCGIFDKRSGGANYSQFPQIALTSGAFIAYVSYTGSSWAGTINGATPAANTWTHVAFVRNANTWTLYVNGVSSGTPFTAAGSVYTSTDNLVIGASTTAGLNPFNGLISNARVVKGTALYTANFTPPTAPLTAIANTSLLLNYTNGGIIDATAKNVLETVGNAQISTAQSKFGGSSMAFDGSGDYLLLPSPQTQNFVYGTRNFTIEFWFYMSALAGSGNFYVLYDGRPSVTTGAYVNLAINNATPESYVNGTTIITGSALSANTWYHFAYARSGSSTKMFINGTQVGSTYTDNTNYINAANRPVIGTSGFSIGSSNFNGYINDLRITRGYARYTSNFTPPTAAFPLL